ATAQAGTSEARRTSCATSLFQGASSCSSSCTRRASTHALPTCPSCAPSCGLPASEAHGSHEKSPPRCRAASAAAACLECGFLQTPEKLTAAAPDGSQPPPPSHKRCCAQLRCSQDR